MPRITMLMMICLIFSRSDIHLYVILGGVWYLPSQYTHSIIKKLAMSYLMDKLQKIVIAV